VFFTNISNTLEIAINLTGNKLKLFLEKELRTATSWNKEMQQVGAKNCNKLELRSATSWNQELQQVGTKNSNKMERN